MKKRVFSVIGLLIMALSLSGCVKFDATMDIKKDKSMDFSIIYAVDTTYFGDETLIDDESKGQIEKGGFSVEDYQDDKMKGVKVYRNIKNIDDVSTNEDNTFDLSGMFEKKDSSESIFKVKKGLIKNKYTASLHFDTKDSNLNDDLTGDDDIEYTDDYEIEDNTTGDDFSNLDFSSSLTSSMDLKFKVNLPYSAIRSNATSSNNDNKELSWDLTSFKEDNIEFEFELYNLTNIYIIVGVGIILILLLILFITKNNNKKVGEAILAKEENTIETLTEDLKVQPTLTNTNTNN